MTSQQARGFTLESLQRENQRLKRALEELSMLNDLARAIGASHNADEVMQTIIRRSLRAVHAEQGTITLVDEQSKQPMKTLVRTMASSSGRRPFHVDEILLGWMHLNKKPLVINDPGDDDRFRGVTWDESIRSLLCVPLIVKSDLKGVLTVYNKKGDETFNENDQRLLAIIAAQSAQVVENARLYEQEQSLLQMQEQLRLASLIQLQLLPKTIPQIAGYDIAGSSIPARTVGGDYFDFISMGERRLAICLGDVSGKGLPASLLMANLQATIRGQTLTDAPLKECVQRSNRLLFQSTDEGRFVTLFYAILDAEKHELCYSNAGHNPPLVFSTNEQTLQLTTGGIPIGIMEGYPFEDEVMPLNPGDMLVVYSDGITEAENANGEEFGEKTLVALVKEQVSDSAHGLVETVIAAVKQHAGDAPQTDDMTLVVMKREKA